jgi:hypothetical protein
MKRRRNLPPTESCMAPGDSLQVFVCKMHAPTPEDLVRPRLGRPKRQPVTQEDLRQLGIPTDNVPNESA